MRSARLFLAVAIAAIAASSALAGTAGAETFKVTRKDDPKPGKCKEDDCSLREAISRANALDGKDRVLVPKGRFELELPEDGTDDNDNGDLDVSGEVLIKGAGARKTKVDANGVDGVFTFLGFSPHTLKGLTVRGGNDPNGGGGVSVGPSPLTLTDLIIKRNTGEDGGGLRTVSPELKLRRVSIERNEVSDSGGGIYFGVSVADVEASIKSSTIARNEAGGDGGGVAANGDDTIGGLNTMSVAIENSTIALNAASGSGGGVAALDMTMTLMHATVSENEAEADGLGGSTGGGISSTGSAFQVFESIVADNSVQSTGADLQCSGAFLGSGNVLNTPIGCNSFSQGPDELVVNALIGTLQNNGGPTKTVKPQAASPAIGFGFSCPARDQRGKPRPDSECDTGAYERKGP